MNQKKRTKFFITFIEPHYLGVYHFILGQVKNKELAEDLTQLTMEHAWAKIDQLTDTSMAHAWCMKIAKNEIAHYYRGSHAIKRSAYLEEPLEELDIDLKDEHSDVLKEILYNEEWEMAMEALTNLESIYYDVLALRLIEDLSFKEISVALDINISTARNRYVRGLQQLRECYNKILERD